MRERKPMNAPIFLVHSLRDQLYDRFDGVPLPLGAEAETDLEELSTQLADVDIPDHPTKGEEVLKERHELAAIIGGLRSGKLKSRLRTNLPYPLCRQPIEVLLRWEGLDVVARLTSEFVTPSQFWVQTAPPNAVRPTSTTRWQYGSTSVEIELHALIDPSLRVPALQMPATDVPLDAWPNGLRVAYEIIYQSCWALRGREEYVATWVPAPGDLGDIESTIMMPDRADLGFIRRSHPSVLFELFTPSPDPIVIDIGAVTDLEWFKRCRVMADQYASLGEVREAIFWLNVGVEALLRSRMEAHIKRSGCEIDLDILDSGKTYWDDARQLVASKFPELAEEIDWPTAGKKPSLFQQLKFYSSNVPGAASFEPAKTHYSKVARHRNDLFHGNSAAPISIADVQAAMQSFDWLAENFSVPVDA